MNKKSKNIQISCFNDVFHAQSRNLFVALGINVIFMYVRVLISTFSYRFLNKIRFHHFNKFALLDRKPCRFTNCNVVDILFHTSTDNDRIEPKPPFIIKLEIVKNSLRAASKILLFYFLATKEDRFVTIARQRGSQASRRGHHPI